MKKPSKWGIMRSLGKQRTEEKQAPIESIITSIE
jgi:hypothetical protein